MPILVDRGKNVERCEDIGDHKVQVSEGKVSPGADPMSLTFSIVMVDLNTCPTFARCQRSSPQDP